MTKIKIETITPVHVGTGDTKLPVFYMYDGAYMSFYDEKEVFAQIPNNVLLDKNFLKKLSHFSEKGQRKGQSPSKYLQDTMRRYVNFSKLTPRYQLSYDLDDIVENKKYSEHIKTLDKPYIPGSSLKGAILNALYYNFLLSQENQLKYELEDIYKLTFDSVMKVLGISSDTINDFNSCLIVRDIPFSDLRIMEAERTNTRDPSKALSNALPLFECIDYGQNTTDDYILINKEKLQLLKKDSNPSSAKMKLLNMMSEKGICEACNRYMTDIFEEELELDNDTNFYTERNLRNAIKGLRDESHENTNAFYLRIGSSTSYFSKTVSLFFKNKFPREYVNRFNQAFSPSKGKKTKPKPETLPKTRMLYVDDQVGNCYPGVIRIEYTD